MKKIEQDTRAGRVSDNLKRRRGRPDVYSRKGYYEGYDEIYCKEMRTGLSKVWPYKPNSRSMTNLYYILEGVEVVKFIVGDEIYEQFFERNTTDGLRNQGLLEQFGRMVLQNGFSYKECYHFVMNALWRIDNGEKVHDVVAHLRQLRNDPKTKEDPFSALPSEHRPFESSSNTVEIPGHG